MQAYMITSKGRAVLRSATLWGLSCHLRDVLARCEPRVSFHDLRQFMPPVSLQTALFALQELELIEGPPTPAPTVEKWRSTISRKLVSSQSDAMV